MSPKSKNQTVWIILIVLALLFFSGKLDIFSTLEIPAQQFIQFAGIFDDVHEKSDTWYTTYPYPLATGFGEVKFFEYRLVTSKEGGQKTVNIYGEPKCLPNTCNGVQNGTDDHGCAVYAGESSSGTSWSETGDGLTCGGDRSGCTRFVTKREGCAGDGGCVTRSSNDCFQVVQGGGECTIYCSGTCYQPATCGGWGSEVIGTESGRGCWGTYWVYKTELPKPGGTIYANDETLLATYGPTRQRIGKELDDGRLQVRFNSRNLPSETGLECFRIENDFSMKFPTELLNFSAEAKSETVLEGETITAKIYVENYWTPMQGILNTELTVPTVLGDKTETRTSKISVPYGKSEHVYTIPTTLPTKSLSIKPQLDLMFPGTSFAGINGFTDVCFNADGSRKYPLYKMVSLANCDLVKIGTFKQDKFSVVIISQTEHLKDQILGLQNDVAFLNATLSEKIAIANELNLTVTQKTELVKLLNASLAEKARMANELNLTIAQKTELITFLQLDLGDKIDMIQAMTLTLDEKAQMIVDLELSIQQQAETMTALRLKSVEQGSLINDLNLTLEEQKELIEGLDLNVQQQLIVMNNLNINLAEKIALVNRLEITNAEQEYLIGLMRGSFAEQAEILDALNLTITEDASYINQLELSLDAQTGIVAELNLNLQEQADLIAQLDLTVEEKMQLIKNLKLTITEQNRLIDQLRANGGLEPPAGQSITNMLKGSPLLIALIIVIGYFVFKGKKHGNKK